jgi:hypothetical protein
MNKISLGIVGIMSAALISCQSVHDTPEQKNISTNSSSSSVENGIATYTIPEIGMSFEYPTDVFQNPLKYRVGLDVLFRQGEQRAGAGAIRFSYFEKGGAPDYETWYSDYIGDIATESTLQNVCSNSRWPKDMFVGCKIVAEPIPHAEFYIGEGDPETSYNLHKSAIFFTQNSKYPGVFVDMSVLDVPVHNVTETKAALEKLASGKMQSKLVQKFDQIISSIRFDR